MTDFRKGFFPAPRKQEPGIQQKYEEMKKFQKKTHDAVTPFSEENTKKKTKPILYQEVSQFNYYDQMSMDQVIKVVLNLQEEVKKLRKRILS